MNRFIVLSAMCRLLGRYAYKSKRELRDWVSLAIECDQRIKRESAAGRIGLS